MYQRFLAVDNVYANHSLLTYMMSVPCKFRFNKQIVDEIFRLAFPQFKFDSLNAISSRDFRMKSSSFQWSNKISGKLEFTAFKLVNRLNALLLLLGRGKFQAFSPYLTENHLWVYYRSFLKQSGPVLERLLQEGIINKEQIQYFSKPPIRAGQINPFFQIIGLERIIR